MSQMESKQYYCELNAPDALSGDSIHKLPPYRRQDAYLVDDYEHCPENWMRSEGKTSSYFVGVKEGTGMWLDFNKNCDKAHHTAILISVQGVNPISGLKQNKPVLERYEDICPKHSTPFKKDRFCEKCGYQWPMQNYISSVATPFGELWLDGFRTIEGQIRQYLFTKEKLRGVASNIIGEDRVFAIGITFFKSKEKKLFQNWEASRNVMDWVSNDKTLGYKSTPNIMGYSGPSASNSIGSGSSFNCLLSGTKKKSTVLRSAVNGPVKEEKIEIAAGAKIDQSIYNCSEPLSFWEEEPCAQICINYAHKDFVEEILSHGTKDWNPNKEGFLKNIPVGN